MEKDFYNNLIDLKKDYIVNVYTTKKVPGGFYYEAIVADTVCEIYPVKMNRLGRMGYELLIK
jgi:hypothetical protein